MNNFVSLSSPGSSSNFHLGNATPYIYQDFICRLRRNLNQEVKVVHSINQLGIRSANAKKYFKNIESLSIMNPNLKISDTDGNFCMNIKPYIHTLISRGYINKRTCYIFTCNQCPQIFLASDNIYSPKLVEKKTNQIRSFFSPKIGNVCVWSPKDLVFPTAIGVPEPLEVETVLGPNNEKLPVVYQPNISKATLFSKLENVEITKNILEKWNTLNKIDVDVLECRFCGNQIEPTSMPCWIFNNKGQKIPNLVQGAISFKNVKQLYDEMTEETIISRPRNKSGILLNSLNENIGIENQVLDPEFSLQFLPLILKERAGTITETYISEAHLKYVTSSISLYGVLNEKPIEKFILLGNLLGHDRRPMKRMNNNADSLYELIDKWGIDVIRLAIADINLTQKRNAVISEGHYKGWNRFLRKVSRVSHYIFEKTLYQYRNGNLLEDWEDKKEIGMQFALNHNWGKCIKTFRDFINITVSKDLIPKAERNLISVDDLYTTIIDFLKTLYIFAPKLSEELVEYGNGEYVNDDVVREKGKNARIQYQRNF